MDQNGLQYAVKHYLGEWAIAMHGMYESPQFQLDLV